MSDRRMDRCTLETWSEDLDAVLNTLGPEPVVLLAHSQGSMLAIHYASLNPHRVSHLVIYGGIARGRLRRGPDSASFQETQAQREAIISGWGAQTAYSAAFRRIFYSTFNPRMSEETVAAVDEVTLRRWSMQCVLGHTTAAWDIDVSDQARRVSCPTLAFHARGDRAHLFEEGCRLAALIPGARFVPVDSDCHLPTQADAHWPMTLSEIKDFVGVAATDRAPSVGSSPTPVLTPRQIEVLRLVAQGQSDKQIARALGLSPRTVEMHVANAISSSGARTRAEAVGKATTAGWLD